MRIDGRDVVGRGFPPDEGKKLAEALLARTPDWSDLEIDLSEIAPALLISAFFNGFLQAVHEQKPELLESAKKVKWVMQYEFQLANVKKWMEHFKPTKNPAKA